MTPNREKRPTRQADGSWRYATEPSALRRNRDWDYRRPGSYEITLTLADRSRDWLGRTSRGHFSAIGNHFLLQRPLLQRPLWQVQVSRRDFAYRRVTRAGRLEIARDEKGEPIVERTTPAFERASSLARAAAQAGDVIISPCVSDGERQIARETLAAQWPLVTLQNKGFAKLQKPTGAYFDACAEGRREWRRRVDDAATKHIAREGRACRDRNGSYRVGTGGSRLSRPQRND